MDCVQTDTSTNILFFIWFWGKAFLDNAQYSLGFMFTEFNWMCLAAEQRHQREAEGKPSLPSVMASIFMLLLSWTSRSNTKCIFFPRPPRLSTTSVLYGKGINWTAGESSFQSELSNAVVGGSRCCFQYSRILGWITNWLRTGHVSVACRSEESWE